MSTLIIRKKSLKTWLHTDSVLGNFIISKFYFSADDNSFQIVEQGQSKRIIYNVSDITLYDEPNGGGAETFTTITALSLRLEQLNYPAFQYDGQITSIANLIAEGTNITITGDGTEASPYVISATGGGFGTPKLSEVLAEENITDGNDIVISNGDAIELENLSKLQQGTIDNGFGGGISQICTAEKEQQWENGVRYLRAVGGTNVFAETLDDIIPDNSYDNTKNWAIDSYFKNLVTQKLYKCTDDTTGSAVWEEQASGSQTLQQTADVDPLNTNLNIYAENTDGDNYIAINLPDGSISIVINDGIGDASFSEQKTTQGYTVQLNNSITNKTGSYQILQDGRVIIQQTNTGETSSTIVQITEPTADTTWSVPAKSAGSYDFASTDDIPSITGLVPYTGATTNVDLGEFELKAGQIELDTTPTGTAGVAVTRWNDTIGSSETTLKGGSVVLKNGVDLVARVVNKVTPNTTLTKAAYQVVRISGAQGQRLAVNLAQANNDNNSADTLGIVTETIATNQEGFIMTVGQLEGINTTGSLQGETWADGDVLYLSPTTAGRVTNIKPNGSTGHIVVIGYVEYAHVNNGKIYVKIMNGWELDELHNVFIDTPLNNQALTYETSTDLWKNKTIIEDNITNDVTDKAPSQNAVFDALAENVEKAILKDLAFWISPQSSAFAYSPSLNNTTYLLSGNSSTSALMTQFATTSVASNVAFKRRHDGANFVSQLMKFNQKIRFQTNLSGQRFFHGFTKGNQFSAPTNVEPSTLTDIVGVCQLSTSTNMHVIHNDSSGTATTIDLGSDYPCNTNTYNYFITIQQTTTSYIVTVERVTVATGVSISETRTLTTNIMNYATGVIQVCTWITNNLNLAVASYLDGGYYGNFKL
jgi:nitrogen fixation protein